MICYTVLVMEIYIEYAFLENFLFDGGLLVLALYAAKSKIKWWRVCLSASLGGAFALLFPFIALPSFLKTALKFFVGALLCLLAFPRLKTRGEWRSCAWTTVFFFIFSFGFGGALLGAYANFQRVPSYLVYLGFTALCGASVFLLRKFYARKAVHKRIYPCTLLYGESRIHTQAFLDSGNLATKNGLPVCFLSPELFYELYGAEILEGGGQVCDEMSITTLSGGRKAALYHGEIEIEGTKKDVYFSPAVNMIGREYKVLLNFQIMENGHETH